MRLAMKIVCSIGFVVALYLGAGVMFSKARAQEKTFPQGVPVETQALFCFDQKSAEIVADNKGDVPQNLILERKCAQMRGVAIYVREVYRNGEWAVWELKSGNLPTFYEPTDWKVKKSGTDV